MGKRQRIVRDRGTPVHDETRYEVNTGSVKARKIIELNVPVVFDLWFDKHYLDRIQHGDEHGERYGIDEKKVEDLIAKALPHLIVYSSKTKGFHYSNHNLPKGDRALRLVFQDSYSEAITLNVVLEIHLLGLTRMEVTVKTAMSKNNFELSDGQYSIELLEPNHSLLRLRQFNRTSDVAEYTE
jgi:hypothetical protein